MSNAATLAAPARLYAIVKGAPSGSHFAINAPLPADDCVSHLEQLRLGKTFRRSVACPVNGDGYWYTAQYLLNDAGEVRGSIARHDLGGGEL